MTKPDFDKAIEERAEIISRIQHLAHEVHASVNQHYDKSLPYSVHLDMVARNVMDHGAEVCACADDVVPILFGAYFHDSIEDARLTYNDVKRIAVQLMPEGKAHIAAEIVYALTNEKGRTRAERANDRYYEGIRATPYAPLAKMADRLANVSYSCGNASTMNQAMRHVYASEMPHFLAAVTSPLAAADPRFAIPQSILNALDACR